MPLLERSVTPADLPAMAALVYFDPKSNLHVLDMPYRLCSWTFDYPENTRLWFNAQGDLLAWAVLQVPFWTMDYAYRPDAPDDIHQLILNWADAQAKKLINTPSGHSSWFVPVFSYQTERIRDLESAGFVSQANLGEDSWSQVLMQHDPTASTSSPALPAGFTIRPLAGEQEVEAYVDLHRLAFESKNMTTDWRRRTLSHPAYRPELDLVVVAPNGQLAAFCVCWLGQVNGLLTGQIEPLGVHPDFRKLGLGQAVLSEGIKRMYQHGAERLWVETDNFRNAAFHLYESAGFRVLHEVWMYRKDYE